MDEIEDALGRTIAVVWTRTAPPGATARPQFRDCPKGTANAALFIAAPDLLAALERIANYTPHQNTHPTAARQGLQEIARSAIAKATKGADQ